MRTRVRDDELDIQVGSCIYLNVCLFWNIALHLGRISPLRAIPLLSISSPCRGCYFTGTGSVRGDDSS